MLVSKPCQGVKHLFSGRLAGGARGDIEPRTRLAGISPEAGQSGFPLNPLGADRERKTVRYSQPFSGSLPKNLASLEPRASGRAVCSF